MVPDASGVDELVPVNSSVQRPLRVVVLCSIMEQQLKELLTLGFRYPLDCKDPMCFGDLGV